MRSTIFIADSMNYSSVPLCLLQRLPGPEDAGTPCNIILCTCHLVGYPSGHPSTIRALIRLLDFSAMVQAAVLHCQVFQTPEKIQCHTYIIGRVYNKSVYTFKTCVSLLFVV
jgi:hypothetical protein